MHICPVCGFVGLKEPPHSTTDGGGSYEVCRSCGVQFGVSDDDEGYSYEVWRKNWIAGGMRWSSKAVLPPRG